MSDTKTATPTDAPASNGKTKLTDTIATSFSGGGSITDKAKAFYKAKPVAAIALAGVAGLAILNTLRGRR